MNTPSPVFYILGLFENEQDRLFKRVRDYIESQNVHCEGIELYAGNTFGAYDFSQELQRIQKIVNAHQPKMIVAHSLGAYVTTQLSIDCPAILLDPSYTVKDVIMSNLKHDDKSSIYDDGEYRISLSLDFFNSIQSLPSIDKGAIQQTSIKELSIFGAGKGGYKIAERYLHHLPHAQYTFLQNADHNFSHEQEIHSMLVSIKKRLDVQRVG